MLNNVTIIGSLLNVDYNEPKLRMMLVERVYSNYKESIIVDKIPIMNWNKEAKGEIFVLPENTLVAIKGRLETFNDRVVIVVETITNLGLKY